MPYLEAAELPPGGLRLHHLHRQQRSAARAGRRGRAEGEPDGRRRAQRQSQFRRPHQPAGDAPTIWRRRRWWSPTRWPARVDIDLTTEPLGDDPRRQARLPARHLAHRRRSAARPCSASVRREMFQQGIRRRPSRATRNWKSHAGSHRRSSTSGTTSPLTSSSRRTSTTWSIPRPPCRICAACACWRCWAIRSPPITSRPPAPSRKDSPAGTYLIAQGVQPRDFNSYGARRGNHEVMVRGTLANIRLRNQLAPGTEGGWTTHLPDGEQMFIYDASVQLPAGRRAAADHRGQGVRLGIVARLGGQGRAAAGREGRDRRELRAHPSLQPGRHGRAAAAVPAGRKRAPA